MIPEVLREFRKFRRAQRRWLYYGKQEKTGDFQEVDKGKAGIKLIGRRCPGLEDSSSKPQWL